VARSFGQRGWVAQSARSSYRAQRSQRAAGFTRPNGGLEQGRRGETAAMDTLTAPPLPQPPPAPPPPAPPPAIRGTLVEAVAATRRPGDRGLVVAVIPAHDEVASIGEAVGHLYRQEEPPDLVVVCADNCTDRTADVATAAGAYVYETVGNVHKKAGALNQALDRLLPVLRDDDAILVMDADSYLAPTFVAEAKRKLREGYGGVGGVFTGRSGGGYVGMLQRNEYARYARDVDRRRGKVLVLTGTATLFAAKTLRHVVRARAAGGLPGGAAQVYDTRVLTEDNELTLALLHLGYKVVSPRGARLTTEVMESWRDLYRQRLRWKRGAVENLRDYGLTRVTLPYWLRQVVTFVGILVSAAYLCTLLWSLTADHTLHLQPLWLAVTGIFMAERVVTVRSRGPVQMALAATLAAEMAFDIFLQGVHAKALWDALTNRERRW
jgi:cellulose synthase/poly-beta-1,6-N-acetylglucosamine synthase-like glycosyltransferase